MLPKQVKEQLQEKYPYRIEMHAHTTPASGCSEITPPVMVQTYRGLDYAAIILTNHFMYQGDKRTREEYVDRYLADYEQTKSLGEAVGLKVYLGAEIRFAENTNDYLIYGVDRDLLLTVYDYLPKGLEAFRKELAMPKSVFVQAHPLRQNIVSVDPALLDGYEAFNMHPGHNSRVGMASVFAGEHSRLIVTGGSDFHHPNRGHEGVAAMRAPRLPKDSWDVAALLRSQDYLLEIGRNHLVL